MKNIYFFHMKEIIYKQEVMTYNPFNPVGRYYLKKYLYDHKNEVLGFTVLFILLFILLVIVIWYYGRKKPMIKSASR